MHVTDTTTRTAALGVSMWKMIVLIILPADPNMDSQLRDGPSTRLQTFGSGLFELALQVNLWLLYTFIRYTSTFLSSLNPAEAQRR